jgi:hypothetical protein
MRPPAARAILAFWVTPLVAPILYTLSETFFAIGSGTPVFSVGRFAFQVAATSIYILPVSYLGLLALGLPSLVFLDMCGRLNLACLIVVAAVEGVIVVFLYLSAFLDFWWADAFQDGSAALFLGIGAATAIGMAIAFWFISGHYRGIRQELVNPARRQA